MRRLQRFNSTLLLIGIAACAPATSTFSSATPLRPGDDLPLRFDPPTDFARVAGGDTIPGNACVSPLHDPRDGTLLRMVRSSATQADYEVAERRYGVTSAELLRVECNTGRPLGIVRR